MPTLCIRYVYRNFCVYGTGTWTIDNRLGMSSLLSYVHVFQHWCCLPMLIIALDKPSSASGELGLLWLFEFHLSNPNLLLNRTFHDQC